MAGIGVVLNPKSRKNLKDPRAARRLATTLGDHGVVRERHGAGHRSFLIAFKPYKNKKTYTCSYVLVRNITKYALYLQLN
jgi:hypothetical protein